MSDQEQPPRGGAAAAGPTGEADPAAAVEQELGRVSRTRAGATWVAVAFAIAALIVILIFILGNLETVRISFAGAHGELPLGVALLFAALLGAFIVLMIGATRIVQLRIAGRRARRRATAGR